MHTSDIIFAFDGLLKTFYRKKIFGLHNEKEQRISNQINLIGLLLKENIPVLQTSDIIFAFDGLLRTFYRKKIFGLHNEQEQRISNQIN